MATVGDVLGEDEVLGRLGRGGTGEVYHVRNIHSGHEAALKVLFDTSEKTAVRLRREARILTELRHPAIVTVHALVELPHRVALRMDKVDGVTLTRWMEDNPAPARRARAVGLFRAMLEGIACAHDLRIVHRDLKPDNILVDAHDQPHILDFGIAKQARDVQASVTLPDNPLGTPAYTAPEQHDDPSNIDQRCDVFSLGCLLYELLLGVPPYQGDPMPVMMRILRGRYTDPLEVDPTLEPALAHAIRGALETKPGRRIPDCRTFGQVMDGARWPPQVIPPPPVPMAVQSSLVPVLPTSSAQMPRDPPRDHYTPMPARREHFGPAADPRPDPRVVAAGAVVVVLLVGAGAWLLVG